MKLVIVFIVLDPLQLTLKVTLVRPQVALTYKVKIYVIAIACKLETVQSITAFMTKITKFSELSINGIGICTLYTTVKLVPPSFQNIFLTNGGPEGGSDNVLKYILSVDISSSDECDSETSHEHDKEQPKEKLYCSYRKIIIK